MAQLGKGPLLSLFRWLLGGFSYLQVVGLRASALCWFLARDCPQFFATRPLQCSSLFHQCAQAEEAMERELD